MSARLRGEGGLRIRSITVSFSLAAVMLALFSHIHSSLLSSNFFPVSFGLLLQLLPLASGLPGLSEKPSELSQGKNVWV